MLKFPKNFFPVLIVNDSGAFICTTPEHYVTNLAYYIADSRHLCSTGKGVYPFYTLDDKIDVQDLITHNLNVIRSLSKTDRALLLTVVNTSFDTVIYDSEPSSKESTVAVKEQTPVKHSHYHKDVSNLNSIDIYDILYLYNVTDPTIQHAIKKLLVPGGRGGSKDFERDITEAIDSLVRGKELRAVHAKKDK